MQIVLANYIVRTIPGRVAKPGRTFRHYNVGFIGITTTIAKWDKNIVEKSAKKTTLNPRPLILGCKNQSWL